MLILNVMLNELKIVAEVIILHTLKKIKTMFLALLPVKFFVLMINLISHMFFTEDKMRFIDLLQNMFVAGE